MAAPTATAADVVAPPPLLSAAFMENMLRETTLVLFVFACVVCAGVHALLWQARRSLDGAKVSESALVATAMTPETHAKYRAFLLRCAPR